MKHTKTESKQMAKLQLRVFDLVNLLQRQHKITDTQATDFSWRTGYGALYPDDVKAVIAELEVISAKPAPWQINPDNIKTGNVQLWRRGVLTTVVSNEAAKAAVREGRAFVISDQAIGAIVDGRMES